MRALAMKHAAPPDADIMARVAKFLPGMELMSARTLVGIYQRPPLSSGGVILPDQYRDEDIYQGKAGLVLKMGPLAFVDDEDHKWGERVPKVGDWIAFKVSEGWPILVGEQHCRVLEDVSVQMIIQAPDKVY